MKCMHGPSIWLQFWLQMPTTIRGADDLITCVVTM